MITNSKWKRYLYTMNLSGAKNGKKVESIEFDLQAGDIEGTIHITDLQLQEGQSVSSHMPNTEELLDSVSFNIDEFAFLNTVSNPVKVGVQPNTHQNVRNRFYNVVNRGHSTIAIPNVFHEDYTFPIVTTGLDLTLYAKDDFDLLRIRTHDGGLVEGRKYDSETYPNVDPNHPLNWKYTREFYFDGAVAGTKIELKTTIRSAKLGGQAVPLNKHQLNVAGETMNIDRQRFMLAPAGSFRLGIEFYKKDASGILVDTGIGYYGTAELNQWTYGVSKL